MVGKTLYDKIWDAHLVAEDALGEALLYIDLHLVNEVTSPQAFAGLREAGRKVRRPERCLAVADHNTPTEGQSRGIGAVEDAEARLQLETLSDNIAAAGIPFFAMGTPGNGIVHVVAPELGRTLPGMTVVCGDSHTTTHGAFGALAHGIGTSEVEHVLATQTLHQAKSRNMRVLFTGRAAPGLGGKDFALELVRRIGTGGAIGHVIEYGGEAVAALSMEGRMTLCNMTVEAGARAGIVPPDDRTIAYLKDLPGVPTDRSWDYIVAEWLAVQSDLDARFDAEIVIEASDILPMVTWGTSPEDALPIDGRIPDPSEEPDAQRRAHLTRALDYMGLAPGVAIAGTPIDRVFIGSCTNARIEDLRAAAVIARGRQVSAGVRAMIVPGSRAVMREAEREGIDAIFRDAGFEWREPGCSMCLGMNPDRLAPGERCASTSNRNFEGRQGRGGRTHLMSPAMAAAAAIAGHIVDFREYR